MAISNQPEIRPAGPIGIDRKVVLKQNALVLSGGASRGDFEVGAVQYLYRIRGLHPSIICGTSVGAINALKLAEGEPKTAAKAGPDGHLQGLAGLEEIWLSLQKNDDANKIEKSETSTLLRIMKRLFAKILKAARKVS